MMFLNKFETRQAGILTSSTQLRGRTIRDARFSADNEYFFLVFDNCSLTVCASGSEMFIDEFPDIDVLGEEGIVSKEFHQEMVLRRQRDNLREQLMKKEREVDDLKRKLEGVENE